MMGASGKEREVLWFASVYPHHHPKSHAVTEVLFGGGLLEFVFDSWLNTGIMSVSATPPLGRVVYIHYEGQK